MSFSTPSRAALFHGGKPARETAPRPFAFLLLYALAYAGGVIGFLPLLTLLLPLKIETVAGDAKFALISITMVVGAVVASMANIVFGWLSDASVERGRSRRRWVAGGLIATALSYPCLASATTPYQIVAAVILYQVALNALLAPLVAMMADEIPDAQKGLAGGLLALANPIASGLLAVLISIREWGENGRLMVVVVAVALCVVPLLFSRARLLPTIDAPIVIMAIHRRDLAATWCARLFMQVSGVVLQLYLFYYFESISAAVTGGALAARVGHLLFFASVLMLPMALVAGRLSDRIGSRKPFLFVASFVAALGLLGMAGAGTWVTGAAAFALYTIGAGSFLPLQAAFSMQLLPNPRHRGRDLGLLNLTNTLPSLLGPALTWALATPHNFTMLMLALAILTLGSGFAVMCVRGHR